MSTEGGSKEVCEGGRAVREGQGAGRGEVREAGLMPSADDRDARGQARGGEAPPFCAWGGERSLFFFVCYAQYLSVCKSFVYKSGGRWLFESANFHRAEKKRIEEEIQGKIK